MKNKITKIGGVEIKRTYRPARIICDVFSLAALVVVTVIAANMFAYVRFFLGELTGASVLLFPAVGTALCVMYVILTFKSLEFKRYKITKQNAQNVYNWWSFFLSLAKIPLLAALFEGEIMFRNWAVTGRTGFSFMIVLYVLAAVIIMRLSMHRIKSLTAVKKTGSGGSAVNVKVKIVDDDDKEN